MEEKNITLTIDNKLHKLVHSSKVCFCSNCSLSDFCNNTPSSTCPAHGLGGAFFVELKVEK